MIDILGSITDLRMAEKPMWTVPVDLERLIELEALITEREGMIVENQLRVIGNNSPTYGEKEFDKIASRIRALSE